MQFMMMIYEPASDFAAREAPDAAAYYAPWMAYAAAMRDAGIMVGGNGLQPPEESVSLRLRDGRRVVQDGPFADSKEQLGGYFVIDVADMATALDWAARSPSVASGGVEVRPLMVRA